MDEGQTLHDLYESMRLPGEGLRGRWGGKDSRASEFLNRCTQWVMIDAGLNARTAAHAVLRLYRKATLKRRRAKAVPAHRLRLLRNPLTVGMKTASQFADDVEEVVVHPVLDLIRSPNVWMSGIEYAEQRAMSREVFGNAYSLKIRDGSGTVVGLVPLMAQYVAVVPGTDSLIGGYVYGRNRTALVEYKSEDVIRQIHAQNPWNPYYGMPPMLSVVKSIDRMDASEEWALAIYRNMGRPDCLLVAKDATGPALAKLEERYSQRFRGPANAGKAMAVSDVDVRPIGWTPRDLQDATSRAEAEAMIHAAYGVPPSFARLNDANLASSTTGYRQYFVTTIQPRLAKDADDLTNQLLNEFEEPGEYWFAYDPMSSEDEDAQATRLTQYVSAGVLTPNEARTQIGYEAVTEGGADALRGGSGEPPALVGAGGEAEPDKGGDVPGPVLGVDQVESVRGIVSDVAAGKMPAESARALISAAYPMLTPEQVDAIIGPLDGFVPVSDDPAPPPAPVEDEPEPEEKHSHGHGRVVKTSSVWCRCGPLVTGTKALGPDEQSIADAVRAWLRAFEPDLSSATSPARIAEVMRAAERAFPDATRDSLLKVFSLGYDAGVSQVKPRKPDMGAFAFEDEQSAEFLNTYQVRLARSVSDSYEQRLRQVVSDGLRDGMSTDQIANELRSTLGDLSKTDAERIARTEAGRAQVEGRHAAWEASGVVAGKEWLLSSDPCELCRALADRFNSNTDKGLGYSLPIGTTIQGDEGGTYVVDYADVKGPPGHPNCTCDLAPTFEDD